jgi:two-component system nitrate/nitrite response regulator NarL
MTARSKPSSVVIATPDAEVRTHWKQGLRGMFKTYQVSDRSDLEKVLLKVKPAILLVDLNVPNLNGIKGMIEIQSLSSTTKIIVLTQTGNETERLLALEAGARGYCAPDIDMILMKKAVQIVQKGEIWAQRSTMLHVIKELTARNQYWERISHNKTAAKLPSERESPLNDLTNREREIAMLVGQGSSNKQIATLLTIAEATVKAHLTVIFRKLGISDRLALAVLMNSQLQ